MKFLFSVLLLVVAFQVKAQAKPITCESEAAKANGEAEHLVIIRNPDIEEVGQTTKVVLSTGEKGQDVQYTCTLKRHWTAPHTTKYFSCKGGKTDLGLWLSQDSEMSWANFYGDITLNGMGCFND